MGQDDRGALNAFEKTLPLVKQTGLIQIQGEAFVTGLVLGNNCDVVVTVGHAVFYWKSMDWKGWRMGKPRGDGKFLFYSNPRDKTSGISMSLVKSGYQNIDNIPADEHDWAVFRLAKSAGNICAPVAIERSVVYCDDQLLMPAFHFDFKGRRLIDRDCATKHSVGGRLIIHDCDGKDGSSGAPLICGDSSAARLIGINVGGYTKRGYHDPGIYKIRGANFNMKYHKNYAVSIHGEFYKALQNELELSRVRAVKYHDID